MTENDVVLEKLTAMDLRFKRLEESVEGIGKAVQKIAVQDERINHIDSKTSKLFQLHDNEFGPEGVIGKIQQHQSQCPKKEIAELKKELSVLRGWFFRLLLGLGAVNAGGIASGIIIYVIK